jgi:hypothetical protein
MGTSELSGAALDYAVAKCEGIELENGCYNRLLVDGRMSKGQSMLTPFTPSTDWAQGGAIIEREKINLLCRVDHNDGLWSAYIYRFSNKEQHITRYEGKTPLIAAMRCYVASKLGGGDE